MAARYLILTARDTGICETVARNAAELGLRVAREKKGLLCLISRDADWQCAQDSTLFLVGKLFAKSGCQAVKLDEFISAGSTSSTFDELLDRCWGQYVAVSPSEDGIGILRDPSGGLPCYHVHGPKFFAAASDADLLVKASLLRPLIDYDSISQQFQRPNARSADTGLIGLKELMPGHMLEWRRAGVTQERRWSPWDHARRCYEGSFDAAARHLRDTVDACIKALCRREGGPTLIGMSGGLDSSIIASALREIDYGAEGISVATRHPDGDERQYARQICSRLGLTFHGALYDVRHVDPMRPSASHLARPIGEPFLQSYDRIIKDLARERGARSVIRGNGGDAVFCFMQNVLPILDHWEAKGERRNILQTVGDVCRMTDTDMRTVLSAAWTRKRGSPFASLHRGNSLFLSQRDRADAALSRLEEENVAGLSQGRVVHGLWVMRVARFTEGYARDAELEMICPLLSQPIVELCLSIPSWYWIAGGINRAVARRAYRPILGQEAMQRTRKGGPAAFCVELLETYRKQYRELLLDGLLVQHEVLDRPAVETALAYEGPQRGDDYLRLLGLADAEAWARHWSGAGMTRLPGESGAVVASAGSSHWAASGDALPG